jgi:hypothetical protein
MRVSRGTLIAACVLMAVPACLSASPKHISTKLHAHASVKHSSTRHTKTSHPLLAHAVASRAGFHHEISAVAMPSERATQIQTALIKQGYLSGEPSGSWDSQTVAAMEKLQADNGWQSKVTPDSRALIKLGLGPEQAHETAQNSPH